MRYDAVVIGGGSAGYVVASVLARNGVRTAVVEKKAFGGVCVNSGCIPSIFLSDVSFLSSRLQEIGYYKGLNISVSPGEFFKKRDEVVQYLSEAGRKLVEDAGAEVYMGEAIIEDKGKVSVDGKTLEYDKLFLATGSVPLPPKFPGIDRAISEDEAVNLRSVPSSMVVIGGGFAGVEIAQIYARLGAKVSLLTRSRILKEYAEDVRNVIAEALDWDGVEVRENVEVREVKDERVVTNKGVFEGEVVVYATGRSPAFPKGMERLELISSENGICVNRRMETSNPKVYAVGDVVNKRKKVAHTAMLEGIVAGLNALGTREEVDYLHVPQVIYTDPQVGIVGDFNLAVRAEKFPFSATSRATVSGFREGYVKLGVDEDGKVVYGEVVSNVAEEIVNAISLAIRAGMTVKDLAMTAFVHPSLSEAIVNAARSFYNLDVDRFRRMKND